MTEAVEQISSGLDALMRQYMATTNNIANANTVGYKRSVGSFSADLERQIQNLNNASLSTEQINIEQSVDFSQGQVVSTGRPLDIALEGKGFLVLETLTGPLYTRVGSLDINTLGQLVDSTGRLVAGENGPIVIPQDVSVASIHIGTDGVILAGDQEVGRLRIVEFPDGTNVLRPVGFGAYQAPDDVRMETAREIRVRQSCQENSNVRIMEEVVNLMTLSRIYESHMNILKKRSENSSAMLSVANS